MSDDVNVKVTKQDKAFLDNLVRMLGRAKMELEGVEILAAADSMRWLSRFQKQVNDEFTRPPIKVVEQSPIKESSPVKEPSKRGTKKKGE